MCVRIRTAALALWGPRLAAGRPVLSPHASGALPCLVSGVDISTEPHTRTVRGAIAVVRRLWRTSLTRLLDVRRFVRQDSYMGYGISAPRTGMRCATPRHVVI